jgi:hypothetical protein
MNLWLHVKRSSKSRTTGWHPAAVRPPRDTGGKRRHYRNRTGDDISLDEIEKIQI